MELKTESMKNMKQVVAKWLDDLMKKNDLSPAETKAAIDGFHLYDELCCRIEDCEAAENKPETEMYSEGGYSRHGDPYREYHITSYGMPERAVYSMRGPRMSHGNIHMPRPMEYSEGNDWYRGNNYSMAENGYARLPGYPMEHMRGSFCDPYYADRGNGYSGHSIADRLVSLVEGMMDSTQSDYERQELQKYMRAIRAMSMSE